MPAIRVLPEPTDDLDRARHDLDEHGYCLVANALAPPALAAIRARLVEVAAEDVASGVATMEGKNQRVWSLLTRGEEFRHLAAHPVAMEVLEPYLGARPDNIIMNLLRTDDGLPSFLLGSITANIVGPDSQDFLHVDQFYVPPPWPPYPIVCNIAWMLDDYTAANGATNVVPGSHRLATFPGQPRDDDQVPVEAPAGTAMFFEGRTWHTTGVNTTADQWRHGILSYYCAPWMRTQENHTVAEYAEVMRTATPTLRRLMGLDTYGSLGGVRAIPGSGAAGRSTSRDEIDAG